MLLKKLDPHYAINLARNAEDSDSSGRSPARHELNGESTVTFWMQDKPHCADVAHNRSVRRGPLHHRVQSVGPIGGLVALSRHPGGSESQVFRARWK